MREVLFWHSVDGAESMMCGEGACVREMRRHVRGGSALGADGVAE